MSTTPKKYDVFISFRGDDTRKSFVGYLHEALKNQNIETYIDLYLKVGDEVGPMIVQAIEESHMSIVVLSKNYASSKWCLEELLHILRCRKHHGQVVIPVFYETDPLDVGCHTRSFERAIARYEREVMNNEWDEGKVFTWKAALVEVARISGRISRHYRNDCQMIPFIVKDISQKLSLLFPNELKDLVQIDEKSEDIENHLEVLPKIGIWGMDGLGKTTIAKHIFAKHFSQYDTSCFLDSIRELSQKFGLPYLVDKLLCELLNQRTSTFDNVDDHGIIKKRFNDQKVLIVFDDVDNVSQLDYLCEELRDLGPQSRIIITTRNKDMLISGKIDVIYEVKNWMLEESLELFSFKAFNQSNPKEGYESLSKRVVACSRGFPLALKVLGSHLHSKDLEFWENELSFLENNKGGGDIIQDVMGLSYNNGLEISEKEMFLDIAFFFKDENKDFVTRILDGCSGFNATSGIHILQDKSLITISNDNKIQMHELLQKMAFDIVRYKKGQSSRLRDIEEVCDALKNNKGTNTNEVEGIQLDLSQKVDLHVQADTFKTMKELRFLRLYLPLGMKRLATVFSSEDILPLSCDKLRYLEWNGFPFKSLPQPFAAELLVEIRLPHSDLEHLWHATQELVNLDGIDLRGCKKLTELPDLSRATKLKWLYLSGCENLCEVKSSIFSKDTIVNLLLDRCTKLQSLKSEKHLKSLENINVYGCSSLKEFSLSSDSIERLNLSNTGIEILDSSIGCFTKLVWIKLEGLKLQNLPSELSLLRTLNMLLLSNCNVVTKSKLEAIFDGGGLVLLKKLHLKDCSELFELPPNIGSLSSLYELRLDGSNVETLPTTIKNLSMLEILSLNGCRKLRYLPELPPHTKEFQAGNCTSLVTVSSLKTFSKHMEGVEKYISFQNCIELNRSSLDLIAEDSILTMKSATLHNVLVDKKCVETHSYNYDSAVVCLPGNKVPREFKYKTSDSIVTIESPNLSNSLGFIFSVVVSPSLEEMKGIDNINNDGANAMIKCQCYGENGTKLGYESEWHSKGVMNLNMDHVFVWYDPCRFGIIKYISEGNVSFEFSVTNVDSGELDCFLNVKECGVCPVYSSEFPRLLGMLNLDKDVESYMWKNIQIGE